MRRWRLALVAVAGVLAAAAGTVLAVALNVATGGTARWFPTMERYPLWWTAGGTAGVAGAGLLVWWAQRRYDQGLAELVPAVQRPEPWVVDRPAELNKIIAALRKPGAGTVGITTAVHGAGGFGKTTVAKMVRADRRVLRRFRGRVHWVTVGRDADKQGLVGLVNGLIAQLEPDRAVTFTDARQAGEHLAAVLAKGPRRLLILDDVWTEEQLAVFPVAGRCARLMTTRNHSLASDTSVPVKVDQMSHAQAVALLLAGLPPLPGHVAQALVEETGRWPLLLRLVSKVLAVQAKLNPDITAAAEGLLARLRGGGKLEVDDLAGLGQELDVGDPSQRNKAVRATIQASTSLLDRAGHDRLAELAIFAEDETIPVTLISMLWHATGSLNKLAAAALCVRLADLALLTLAPAGDGGTITMHDVIRDFLREQTGDPRLRQLHGVALDTAAEGLRHAPASAAGGGKVTAWWELPEQARYLRDHLVEHLIAAGRLHDAEAVACDLRWVGSRLEEAGPAAPVADLALVGTPQAERLWRLLGQAAHLLAPLQPAYSLIDILYSRVSHDPDWGSQARTLQAARSQPALIGSWPLPDIPDPALRHVLTGHTSPVTAAAIASDGTWLATGSYGGLVRIWDTATWRQRAVLTSHTRMVTALAAAPDGTWLASADGGGAVRIWEAATGQQRTAIAGQTSGVTALAAAPDGTWLASASRDGSVRISDPSTGHQRAVLTGHTKEVTALAAAPDGTWLASASRDGSVRIWDTATGQQRAATAGHTWEVRAVAVAPDGTWLASGSDDGSVRIWDTATGQQRTAIVGHSSGATAVAVAPDGTWLASAGYDKSVRIWDPATGRPRAVLTGHTEVVEAVAVAPDGTWLATSSYDGSVRIWDTATGQQRAALFGRTKTVPVVAVASDGTWLATSSYDESVRIWDTATGLLGTAAIRHIRDVSVVVFAPDGTWLASGSDDGSVRIWDTATGQQRAALDGNSETVRAMAVAPDGTWLAAPGHDESVRIWDSATGQRRAVLTSHSGTVTAMAIAPDGTWLASASLDGSVRIWDTATGKQRAVLAGHEGLVRAVAVAPDGTWLASARYPSVWIWDAATGQQRAVLDSRTEIVEAMAIAPDGTWLATISYRTVRIWDTATGQRRAVLAGHTGWVTAVAITPDGTWLSSAGHDGSVRIWDTATGQQRAVLVGHTETVSAVAITPDGTWLASASHDGSVRIWDPATAAACAVIRVDGSLEDCRWSPNGQALAVAGAAGLYMFTFKP